MNITQSPALYIHLISGAKLLPVQMNRRCETHVLYICGGKMVLYIAIVYEGANSVNCFPGRRLFELCSICLYILLLLLPRFSFPFFRGDYSFGYE